MSSDDQRAFGHDCAHEDVRAKMEPCVSIEDARRRIASMYSGDNVSAEDIEACAQGYLAGWASEMRERVGGGGMTWDEFREWAAARAGMHAVKGDLSMRLAYLALGLCGEAAEYERATFAQRRNSDDERSELGDVAWYLAMIEHVTGERAEWPAWAFGSDDDLEWPGPLSLPALAGAIAESVKRPMSGREMPTDKLRVALNDVARELAYEATSYGGMGAVMAANVAKIAARYPEGYTVEKARERDGSGR